MIDLYSWATPNGNKVAIMLEETGIEYRFHEINLGRGEQRKTDFLALNPNGKIPVIVDQTSDGRFVLAESGAIILYLARRAGKFLLPTIESEARALHWMMFATSHVGPSIGQLHHFLSSAPENIPYAVERFTLESRRVLAVLDQTLSRQTYLCEDYGVADICTWPWIRSWLYTLRLDLDGFSNLRRWFDQIAKREEVMRAMVIHDEIKARSSL